MLAYRRIDEIAQRQGKAVVVTTTTEKMWGPLIQAYEQTRDGLRLSGARRDREPSRGPLVYAVHGLMTSTPQSSKSFTLRVARLAPLERAIETIMA